MNSIRKREVCWSPGAFAVVAIALFQMPGSLPAQEMINVGSLRQELPGKQDSKKDEGGKSKARKAEDSLIQKYLGNQEGSGVEEIPAPRGRRQDPFEKNNVKLDENGNPVLPPTQSGETEIIRQRYPDGKVQVLRHVIQDEQGNYYNHGPWKLFNRAGQVLAEGTFIDGFMEGSWQRWHNATTGSIFATSPFSEYRSPFLSVAYFKKGKLHGSWVVLDPNRRKVFELGYQDGKRNGAAIWWYPNGMKMRQMLFREGVLQGELIQWDRNGRVQRKERYVEGQQIIAKTRQWSANQKRSEDYYLGSRLEVSGEDDWWNAMPAGYTSVGGEVQHGASLGWYRNGQPSKRGQYQKGLRTGGFTWWYVNGQKKTSGAFQNDSRVGKWVWWHENGMRSIVGNYQAGKPTGKWQWWNADGKLVRETDVDEFPEEIEYDLPDPDSDATPKSEKEESILSGFRDS